MQSVVLAQSKYDIDFPLVVLEESADTLTMVDTADGLLTLAKCLL